ncbi:hypothetical protein QBC33DRAFT_93347 [Phialemonium atrogriseum]|uniref:Uncharacterized protein n=1 Tax=Phialemonium atrogriseum TaxID=1093897 RepID=A0AAJ0BYP7_9PEZI|nr:uncharacterized protein QBC33DRAFT_93347 [Phialemonium atrogriseum]KAK1766914.1 hypothetical protein QBC33DRAFT_93347 [Phialemonium atrogriseum]
MVCLLIFNRPVKTYLWTRFPSDTWFAADDGWIISFGLAIQIPFSLSFLLAWLSYFPTRTEWLMWQICSIYHAAFSILGASYYLFCATCMRATNRRRRQQPLLPDEVPGWVRSGSLSLAPDAMNRMISRDIEEGLALDTAGSTRQFYLYSLPSVFLH